MGGRLRTKIKCVGGVRGKNKMHGGGRAEIFPVRPPLRISNGIALSYRKELVHDWTSLQTLCFELLTKKGLRPITFPVLCVVFPFIGPQTPDSCPGKRYPK